MNYTTTRTRVCQITSPVSLCSARTMAHNEQICVLHKREIGKNHLAFFLNSSCFLCKRE